MCIFCKIANGEIPSYKIYEDDEFMAFLDISQATLGHTLLIPKAHVQDIFGLDNNISSKIFSLTVKLAKQLRNTLHSESINIINNSGALAGQTVSHFHIHLLPRYENDGLIIRYPQNKPSEKEFQDLVQKIKK